MSQVMADKIIAAPRNKITGRGGPISARARKEIDDTLRLWLSLE